MVGWTNGLESNKSGSVPDGWWDGLKTRGLLLRDGGMEQEVGVQQIGFFS